MNGKSQEKGGVRHGNFLQIPFEGTYRYLQMYNNEKHIFSTASTKKSNTFISFILLCSDTLTSIVLFGTKHLTRTFASVPEVYYTILSRK